MANETGRTLAESVGMPKHRQITEIAADIDAVDEKIAELSRRKSELMAEHDEVEALHPSVPRFF
jgi:hypothetical protein